MFFWGVFERIKFSKTSNISTKLVTLCKETAIKYYWVHSVFVVIILFCWNLFGGMCLLFSVYYFVS